MLFSGPMMTSRWQDRLQSSQGRTALYPIPSAQCRGRTDHLQNAESFSSLGRGLFFAWTPVPNVLFRSLGRGLFFAWTRYQMCFSDPPTPAAHPPSPQPAPPPGSPRSNILCCMIVVACSTLFWQSDEDRIPSLSFRKNFYTHCRMRMQVAIGIWLQMIPQGHHHFVNETRPDRRANLACVSTLWLGSGTRAFCRLCLAPTGSPRTNEPSPSHSQWRSSP
ncbi:hypothetical protein BDR22DRAFT_962989 [Usnea florida]